ncbi:coiled-coil domain-containing protein 93-like [Brassica napus]|uniref:coiled-coil domain-containing protein 93-like n=1 Tax=Brassica napus TaxID=3708 RepID=UPI0006AB52E0|nr:coiled-coil domain-containing protein 93-like [Brassica napus]XP_013703476.1 coiled-coil domain-containing protein 93-like [Brassica napus]XP_022545888.1 coiled-coil domain-containing protein 93-like [Brassica napus]
MGNEDSSEEVCSSSGDIVTNLKASIRELSGKVREQNQRKCDVRDKLQQLRERINAEGVDVSVQEELIPLLRSLKELEKQESEVRSKCDAKRSALEDAVCDLEERVAKGEIPEEDLDVLLVESLDHLTSAKKELAATLREIVSLKRQIDDVPCQSELLQYERRFSELNVCIQEKLQQTRKLYGTYNALLEIKDLMLKEISLLNSIGSQFQDVIGTPGGRVKLIDSMEGVMKGIQQKLGKVQLGLQEEQRRCDASTEKYTAAAAEQRKCYTVLRAFQEECTRNDRLRSQLSAISNTTGSKQGM